jgi:hypothetical protein
MPLVNFRNFFCFFSFDFRQNFEVRTFSQWLSIRGTKFFWRDIPNFFSQKVHCGPIRLVPKRFFTIFSQNLHFNLGFLSNFRKLLHAHPEHTRKRFYRTLSIRGNDLIAHWAYEERIFAHAQPAVKVFTYKSMLSIRATNFIAGWAYAEMFKSRISRPNRIRFSKISCYRPLGPWGFGFCRKI